MNLSVFSSQWPNLSVNRTPNRLRRLGSLRAARSGASYLQRYAQFHGATQRSRTVQLPALAK